MTSKSAADDQRLATLEGWYAQFHTTERGALDPVSIPRRYRHHADIEIAALLSSLFAYGQAAVFRRVVDRLLEQLGQSPASCLMEMKHTELTALAQMSAYRFQSAADVYVMLANLQRVVRAHGSLGAYFAQTSRQLTRGGAPTGPLLGDVVRTMMAGLQARGIVVPKALGAVRALAHFLPTGTSSALKRPLMLMRWLVRPDDGVDFGIWSIYWPTDALVIPLDVHTFRVLGRLGLCQRATPSFGEALSATHALKRFDPTDPTRFDFSVCHAGMRGVCGAKPSGCAQCDWRSRCADAV